MIRKNTYRIVAIAMALLVLCSGARLHMDFHFCQGHLKSISLIGQAKSCHQMASSKCSMHQNTQEEQNCCNNEQMDFDELDQDMINSQLDLSIDLIDICIINQLSSFYSIEENITDQGIHFEKYKPPLPIRDIPVHYQSFLL